MPKRILDPNAVTALNQLKEEIANEMGIDPNLSETKKDLSGSVENIYNGGRLGGNMVRRMIEISESQLINKYHK